MGSQEPFSYHCQCSWQLFLQAQSPQKADSLWHLLCLFCSTMNVRIKCNPCTKSLLFITKCLGLCFLSHLRIHSELKQRVTFFFWRWVHMPWLDRAHSQLPTDQISNSTCPDHQTSANIPPTRIHLGNKGDTWMNYWTNWTYTPCACWDVTNIHQDWNRSSAICLGTKIFSCPFQPYSLRMLCFIRSRCHIPVGGWIWFAVWKKSQAVFFLKLRLYCGEAVRRKKRKKSHQTLCSCHRRSLPQCLQTPLGSHALMHLLYW